MHQERRTPKDTNEFEREQLRFFLSRDDLVATLVELNPSLAWLRTLAELNVLREGTQLAPWIEKNFSDPAAVKDIVANMHFFDAVTANILDYRLNEQSKTLPEYLTKSWRLIIRHMRSIRRGLLRNEWFEIAPRLKAGETSPEVLERLSDVLRPKLEVSARLSWRDEDDRPAPERPTDLMSIEYEIEDGVGEDDILSAWPTEASIQAEERLLHSLTRSLSEALEDATDAGVESNDGYSVSDTDVPSVAKHEQNRYRTGFQPITRVIAELWMRLAAKDRLKAVRFVAEWSGSPYRLVRRLALFAAAHPVVPADQAADTLLGLPQGEFFLTNSSVEVYRLLNARWSDISAEKRQALEHKIIIGPPSGWFREGAETEKHIDRARFELLGQMKRWNLPLGETATAALNEIKSRWPLWLLRDPEQAGFRIWHGRGGAIEGKAETLEQVEDDRLVDEATKAHGRPDFMAGDDWQAFCQKYPVRALNGLEADADKAQWRDWAWRTFLSNAKNLDSPNLSRAAKLLIRYPDDGFADIISAASWWINDHSDAIEDNLLWPLWDRIADVAILAVDDEEVADA